MPHGGLDAQQVELVGRNVVVTQLLRSGLEVARPERDRGIDLIAYLDRETPDAPTFHAWPLQLKVATGATFLIDRRFEQTQDLRLIYVFDALSPAPKVYCLSFREALAVAEERGWLKTASWKTGGRYVTTRAPADLMAALEPFCVADGAFLPALMRGGAAHGARSTQISRDLQARGRGTAVGREPNTPRGRRARRAGSA